MYTDHKKYPKLPKLPNDINQALSMLQKSKSLSDAFGSDVINSYIKLKKIEINDFKTKASFNKKSLSHLGKKITHLTVKLNDSKLNQ